MDSFNSYLVTCKIVYKLNLMERHEIDHLDLDTFI